MKHHHLDFNTYNVPFAFKDATKFELFCQDLFNEIYKTKDFQRRGGPGTAQNGFDVFSTKFGIAIQCKVKSTFEGKESLVRKKLWEEFDECIKLIQEVQSTFHFKEFYLLTTFPNDPFLENRGAELEIKYEKKITVKYFGWNTIVDELNRCEQTKQDYFFEFRDANTNAYKSATERPQVPKNDERPLIDQVHEAVSQFWPLQTLARHTIENLYPFNATLGFGHSYLYNLEIKNKNIFDLLKSINNEDTLTSIEADPTLQKKSKEVIKFLHSNLFFTISGEKESALTLSRCFYTKSCDCERCLYVRMEYSRLIESLRNKSVKSTEEKLKRVYVQLQLGFYKDAYDGLCEMLANLDRQKDTILEFICSYNLKNLYGSLDFYLNGTERTNALDKLKNIQLDKIIYRSSLSDSVRKQLKWISENLFVLNLSTNRDEALGSIARNYEKGRNVQGALPVLLHNMLYIQTFVRYNNLFFENYEEFNTYMLRCLEGLIKSYITQSNTFRNPKLAGHPAYTFEFSWLILEASLLYPSGWELEDLLDTYKIENIEIEGPLFLQRATNFLSSAPSVNQVILENKKQEGSPIAEIYGKIFSNLCHLFSRVDNSKGEFNDLAEHFINVFEIDLQVGSFYRSSFYKVLERKGKIFTIEQLKRLLLSLLSDINNSNLTRGVVVLMGRQKILLEDTIIQKLFNQSKSAENLLLDIYDISDESWREKITQEVYQRLDQKFRLSLYVNASIMGIISHTKHFNVALEKVSQQLLQWSYERKGNSIAAVDNDPMHFMLLLYAKKINLEQEAIQKVYSFHPYFKWLTNLESFDYNDFNPDWLLIYPNKIFFEQFRAVPKIKSELQKSLQNKYDEKLSKIFFEKL